MKVCPRCNNKKTLKDFGKSLSYCKPCNSEITRARRQRDPETVKLYDRKAALKRNFGITIEQYDQLLERQNGCCAICQKHSSEFARRLAVDHNHKTGEITGLLCTHCNHRFVGRNRDPEMFQRASEYLAQGTGWYVPETARRPRKRRRKKKT